MDWLRLDGSLRPERYTCSCCFINGSPVVKHHGHPGSYAAIIPAP